MTIRISSGLRDAMVSNWGLGTMLVGGHIQVYSGTQPESADLPPTGTLLANITNNGWPTPGAGGLLLALGPRAGELINSGAWVLKGVASGNPGWWRFVGEPPDNGTQSTTLSRLDAGVAESVMYLPDSITAATTLTLAGFLLSLPNA